MSNPFASGPQGQPQQPQPYGQQPQPYGQQQPYPGQQPPPNYYGAPPQQPQGRKPWMKYLRIAVPVVVVIVAAVVFFTKDDNAAKSAKVGDCMEHIKKGGGDDLKKAECGTPDGHYTVAGKFSGTTNEERCTEVSSWDMEAQVYFYVNENGSKTLLCLNPNANAPDPFEVKAG